MSEAAVKQIVLASRPKGLPTRENFRLEEVPMPELPQGGLLLRVLYLSLDPYMRGRMDDRKSYAKPVDLGEVMTGESVCEVMASDQTGYGVGDIVLAPTGWRTHGEMRWTGYQSQVWYIPASSRPLRYIIRGDRPPRRAIQLRTCSG